MEFINYVAKPPHFEVETPKLTKEELLYNCIEVDGLYYLIDENHSGFMFLTDEVAQKYGIKCGDSLNDDANPIDWDVWNDEGETWKEEGYKWHFEIMQCAGVYDEDGDQIKGPWEDDEDVYIMNGIIKEMLDEDGCEVMSWCDG